MGTVTDHSGVISIQFAPEMVGIVAGLNGSIAHDHVQAQPCNQRLWRGGLNDVSGLGRRRTMNTVR